MLAATNESINENLSTVDTLNAQSNRMQIYSRFPKEIFLRGKL